MSANNGEEEVDYSDDQDEPQEGGAAVPAHAVPQLCEDDIYGDLYSEGRAGDGILPVRAAELQERAEVQEDAIATLQQELQRVLAERDDLRKERAVLVHNISSLFRTAQEELERKDAEIKDLRARVAVQPLPPPPRLPPGSS